MKDIAQCNSVDTLYIAINHALKDEERKVFKAHLKKIAACLEIPAKKKKMTGKLW